MRKQKRSVRAEETFRQVVLIHDDCGRELGNAFRWIGQHPAAGRERVDGRTGRLVPRADGGLSLYATCSGCPSSRELRRDWALVQAKFDALEAAGEYVGRLHI